MCKKCGNITFFVVSEVEGIYRCTQCGTVAREEDTDMNGPGGPTAGGGFPKPTEPEPEVPNYG